MQDLFARSGAVFSPCRRWRYALWRTWDASRPPLVVIGLNPSTADEVTNDPTVERCQRRAGMMDLGGLVMLNLYAWRATAPEDMKRQPDPVGPGNDLTLRVWSSLGPVLCAWGNHGAFGAYQDRPARVRELIRGTPLALKITGAGQPIHPLYVSYSVTPSPWS